ncbi:MAG TPA: penicillin acylase family protein, partial [bacterium]|nr:penicillin acylase family protein [bacterium]
MPAIWYFCHLEVPGVLNAAGSSLAGTPGIVIGRNEHVAWGLTNVMMDGADILTYETDPASPLRYRVGDRWLQMQTESLQLGLPRGRRTSLALHRTEAGPALTMPEPGANAVAVLKWYGTLPEGALTDRSFTATFSFMRATTAAKVLEAGAYWAYTAQNLVAADDQGHIGWQVTGAAPVRRGYSGRTPADASQGADWVGFLPFASLPRALDPEEGWIATANYKPQGPAEGPHLSWRWYPPWRVRRIAAALKEMNRPGVDEFRRLQMDVHSLQADHVLGRLEPLVSSDTALMGAGAREAAALLRSWDREVKAESAGAAVYEVFITELTRCLVDRPLGPDAGLFFNARTYGPENEILDRPASPLWKAAPAVVVEEALTRTIEVCAARMGRDRARWSWGRLHRHVFRHPGARGWLFAWLLNPRSRPAQGDANTINVAAPV